MVIASPAVKKAPTVRLRLVALPVEHGAWGLLGAPLLLGLALKLSLAGGFLAVAALAFFLTRHPLRLAINDLRRKKVYPRTRWVAGFAFAYALVGISALLFALRTAAAGFWEPLIFFVALGCVQFVHDLNGRSRSFLAEASGAIALSSFAAAICLAGGTSPLVAWLAMASLSLHAIGAIEYVAARLKLERNAEISQLQAVSIHACMVAACILATIFFHLTSWITIAFTIVLMRAIWGLSPYRKSARPAIVGIQEVVYSLLVMVGSWLTLSAAAN